MPTQSEHDIQELNRLIEATLDSAAGYHDASAAATGSAYADLFRRRAGERNQVVLTLQTEVQRLGGTAEDDGTILAAAERWFARLKNTVVGNDASVVAEVEAGEDHVKAVFEDVLKDTGISTRARVLVTAAYRTITADHDQMRDLKHAEERRRAG